MHLPNNIFSITLILGGLITLYVSRILFKKPGEAIYWFGFMALAIAIWAIGYGCELSAGTLNQMLFWIDMEYIGIAFLPALWFVFIIVFTGKESWLTTLNWFMIFIIPVTTLLLVCTNSAHHFYYASVSVDNGGPFPMLSIEPAIWYRVHTIYFYVVLAAGIAMILLRFTNADAFIKRQNRIILYGALIPWIVNFIYLAGFRPFGHVDLTPFAFIISSLIIAAGLLNFKLFDIVPIARGKIVDSLQEGILVLDTQNRIVDSNPEMRKIIGFDNITGKTTTDIFPSLYELNRIVLNHENKKLEIKLDDGRCYSVTLTSLLEHQTIYSGKLMLFRDITERKNNEEKLLELNRLKDHLFSIISHDLRAPLLSLVDILNMANDGMVSDEEFKSYLPKLSKNIGYTSGLVENLLLWSKSQLDDTPVNAIHFNISDSVTYVLGAFTQMAADKGVTIHNNMPDEFTVYADIDMIQAVLRNLFSNAIKFCRKDNEVAIDIEIKNNMALIMVTDNGLGIAAVNVNKLFGKNIFTSRGTTNEQGTGIGLVLCKDFVEKNGGTINVKSKLSAGSRFYFTLPLDAPGIKPPAAVLLSQPAS